MWCPVFIYRPGLAVAHLYHQDQHLARWSCAATAAKPTRDQRGSVECYRAHGTLQRLPDQCAVVHAPGRQDADGPQGLAREPTKHGPRTSATSRRSPSAAQVHRAPLNPLLRSRHVKQTVWPGALAAITSCLGRGMHPDLRRKVQLEIPLSGPGLRLSP